MAQDKGFSTQGSGDVTAALADAGGGGMMSRACPRTRLSSYLRRTTFGGGRLLPYLPLQVGLLAERNVILTPACPVPWQCMHWLQSTMCLHCRSSCSMAMHALVAPACRAQRISSAARSATRQCIVGAYLRSTYAQQKLIWLVLWARSFCTFIPRHRAPCQPLASINIACRHQHAILLLLSVSTCVLIGRSTL